MPDDVPYTGRGKKTRKADDRYSLAFELYPYARCADQDAGGAAHHPVVIMGGGPVGIAMALDLGLQGIPVLVLDDHEGPGAGSKAICFAKRSLEIAARYGCGDAMVQKGVIWNLGKVYHRDRKVFEFNLLPEEGHRFPAFINLQQPYFEKFLVEALRAAEARGAPVQLRGRNRVTDVKVADDHVMLTIATPDGGYAIRTDWLIGCDGASSPLRGMLGLGFEGRVFEDNFLIADIKMHADFPAERRFWFEPPGGDAASTLLHKQPDGVWRVDFQIGWEIDRAHELREENVRRRLDAFLGKGVDYELVWTSIYTFQSRRMETFRRGRVLFAGDAAHQVSPFGARGANSGMQDADNLGWKLGLVIAGKAPEALLDTYNEERIFAADENIRASTRSTDFITPKSRASHVFRNAVLDLAGHHAFARPLVNSGRLSVPAHYDGLSLTGHDGMGGVPAISRPGSVAPDAPCGGGFLLDSLGGDFTVLAVDMPADIAIPESITEDGIAARLFAVASADDPTGALAARYLGDDNGDGDGAVYLIRPDQHIVARWRRRDYDEAALRHALRAVCCKAGKAAA